MVGVKLAERLLQRVGVYAGVGQAMSTGCQPLIRAEAQAAAERAGDTEALRDMAALDLSPRADGSLPTDQVQALQRISRR
jgi:hypothetical protein